MTGLNEVSLRWRSARDEALHWSIPEMARRFHQNIPGIGEAASPWQHPPLSPVLLYYGPYPLSYFGSGPLWVAGHPTFLIPLMELDPQQELLWGHFEEPVVAPAEWGGCTCCM